MKVRGGLVLFAAMFAWSAAWATVVETGSTVTSGGESLAGKTLKVEISQPAPQRTSQTSERPRKVVVHRVYVKVDRSGRVNFKYDDRKIDLRTATVRFTEVGGGGLVSDDIPLSSLGPYVGLGRPGTAMPTTPLTAQSVPTYSSPTWSGFYIGLQGSGMAWDQRINERIAGTHIVTNRLTDYREAGGIGVVGGYDWGLSGLPGITFGPTASFNYIGQSNNHNFAGGFFIGTHINWNATIGGRLGWQVNDRFQLYGLGGVEFSNYDLRSNFAGPVIAVNRTVTGWFAGGGVEYSQPDWRTMNGRWTAFGQLTYSEFCGDLFRMPAFSPAFDYKVGSEQVRATAGFTFRPDWFAAPPPPP